MARHINGGLPSIKLMDPNYAGRGVMMLQHEFEGRGLFGPYIGDVLQSLRTIWGNDVILASKNDNGAEKVYWQKHNGMESMDRNKFNKIID
jgi:spore cortex formation protein SpoVR/YcgB (stage V sporulation)